MKIKLFEEYNQYYSNISDEEWHEELSSLIGVSFNQDEVDSIKSMLTSDKLRVVHNSNYIEITYYPKSGIGSRHGRVWMSIQKFEDEWYYVSVYGHSSPGKVTQDSNYYECDQFDGLLHFIEDRMKRFNDFVSFIHHLSRP